LMDKCAVLDAADQRTNASRVRIGKVLINLDERVASVDDQPVHLTGKEYDILELLSLRKGTILTKEMFFKHLYGGRYEPELKIIDVFVLQTAQETRPGDRWKSLHRDDMGSRLCPSGSDPSPCCGQS